MQKTAKHEGAKLAAWFVLAAVLLMLLVAYLGVRAHAAAAGSVAELPLHEASDGQTLLPSGRWMSTAEVA